MDTLRGDLVPSVADPGARLLLGRVAEVASGLSPATKDESGRVTFRVEQTVRGEGPRPGEACVVPFDRAASPLDRAKDGANYWNQVPLARGDFFLLAGRPVPGTERWHADAGRAVAGPDDPAVAELRQCCQLEESRAPREQLVARLAEAFTEPHVPVTQAGLLRGYVFHFIDDRGRVEREDGVEVLARAFASGHVTPDERVEVGDRLTSGRFFRPEAGADAVNRRVIVLLTRGLLAETDPDRRKRWSYYLALCLLRRFAKDDARDRDARRALIRATGTPPPPAVADLLAKQAEEEDESDRKDTLKLLQAWRDAAP
jgi:hypothetical protein